MPMEMRDEILERDRAGANDFYARRFTRDPLWSTAYPNPDEARRWAKIGEFLSQIASASEPSSARGLRILDVGCGRGWLARLASVYGYCEGLDPAPEPIELARGRYPDLTFRVGTLSEALTSPDFLPFDVVVASEVIEHVLDKQEFTSSLAKALKPGGHAIVTTPRGEVFHRWKRMARAPQPVEVWLTESGLRRLFAGNAFEVVRHDRVYVDLPKMSTMHRLSASRNLGRLLERAGLLWVQRGLQYATAIYQAWWFKLGRTA